MEEHRKSRLGYRKRVRTANRRARCGRCGSEEDSLCQGVVVNTVVNTAFEIRDYVVDLKITNSVDHR